MHGNFMHKASQSAARGVGIRLTGPRKRSTVALIAQPER
jgi:hypothetical protein